MKTFYNRLNIEFRFCLLIVCLLLGESMINATTDATSEATEASFRNIAISSEEIEVYLNGKKIKYTENSGKPFIDGHYRTQVPVRQTMETMGAKVTWEAEYKKAIVKLDGNTIEVPLDKYYIVRNGQKIYHDTTTYIENGRIYIPIKIVVESIAGKIKMEKNIAQITYFKQNTSVKRIPNYFDLREFRRITSVKDQKQSGACWAFASLGAMESALMPWQEFDFSEDNLSLGHGYNLSQAEGGDYMIALSYLARWAGPVLEKDDIFGDNLVNLNAQPVKHLQEAIFLPDNALIAIKRAILLYGGVQSSLYLDQVSQWGDSQYYNEKNASYYYDGNHRVNHDVVIIGWDDHYRKENFKKQPKENGAFICKNSFGTAFGDNGYFYISYEDKYIGQNAIAYTKIESIHNYQNIYQSDKLGYLKSAGYGEDTAYFANVYTPKSNEKLMAVSFYALKPESSYEVYVVPNFKSVDDFQRMELVEKGNFTYRGYYTVKLKEGFPINKKFAVVVKIKSPGSKHPIATEAKSSAKWVGKIDLSDGEGYISYDANIWKSSEQYLDANVCLKAFTNYEY